MSRKNYDNSLVLHQIFGQDTKSSNEALIGLLETFLDLKIERIKVDNPNVSMEKLKEKDVPLVVIVTLEDGIKDIIKIDVENDREYEEGFDVDYWCALFRAEHKNRVWSLIFLEDNRYDNDDMINVFRWRNENGELLCWLASLYTVTVEPEKLKELPFEEMNAKERYMYFLKNVTKEDELLKKIVESDENVQALNNRLMEVDGWQNKMHC